MTKEEFLQRLKEDVEYAPGWQAVDDAFEKLYPGQSPKHFGTELQARALLGGDCDEEAFGGEENGWGYEMTFKLREKTAEDCLWAMDMLSRLARYTYQSNWYFEPGDYVSGGGKSLHAGTDSKITALVFVEDTEAEPQQSVYGRTAFLQLVGITEEELQAIKADPERVRELAARMKADGNPDLVTDMSRTRSYLSAGE